MKLKDIWILEQHIDKRRFNSGTLNFIKYQASCKIRHELNWRQQELSIAFYFLFNYFLQDFDKVFLPLTGLRDLTFDTRVGYTYSKY
jgi:hypothetical protein